MDVLIYDRKLCPVFRDIDELSAGNLRRQIKQALENSQNLIEKVANLVEKGDSYTARLLAL